MLGPAPTGVAPLPTLVGNDRECARQRRLAAARAAVAGRRPRRAPRPRGRPPRAPHGHRRRARGRPPAPAGLPLRDHRGAPPGRPARRSSRPASPRPSASTCCATTSTTVVPTPPLAGIELRRGRRREQDAALAVDRAAFAPFWRLDRAGLTEALTATTMVHFQVARDRARGRRLRGVRAGRPPRLRPAPGRHAPLPGAGRRRRPARRRAAVAAPVGRPRRPGQHPGGQRALAAPLPAHRLRAAARRPVRPRARAGQPDHRAAGPGDAGPPEGRP